MDQPITAYGIYIRYLMHLDFMGTRNSNDHLVNPIGIIVYLSNPLQ